MRVTLMSAAGYTGTLFLGLGLYIMGEYKCVMEKLNVTFRFMVYNWELLCFAVMCCAHNLK